MEGDCLVSHAIEGNASGCGIGSLSGFFFNFFIFVLSSSSFHLFMSQAAEVKLYSKRSFLMKYIFQSSPLLGFHGLYCVGSVYLVR